MSACDIYRVFTHKPSEHTCHVRTPKASDITIIAAGTFTNYTTGVNVTIKDPVATHLTCAMSRLNTERHDELHQNLQNHNQAKTRTKQAHFT